MDTEHNPRTRVRFGTFELDMDTGELRRAGVPLRLPAQPTAVLMLLVRHPGKLVSREEIGRSLWHERWAEFEQGINTCVSQIRGALGDQADSPTYIETVPRQGYRFVAPIEYLQPVEHFSAAGGAGSNPSVMTAEVGSAASAQAGNRPGRALRLRWPTLLVASLFVIAAIAVTRGQPPASDPRAMLAVLPFENTDADSTWAFLGAGLTEELITLLANVDPDRLGVIARTSSAVYASGSTIADIGRELGVDYVVEGGVRSGPDRVRITAQLIRVSDQTHIWAQTYDRAVGDALAVERDVARRVTGALAIELVPGTLLADNAADTVPTSPARLTTLQGRFLLNRAASGDIERATALFHAAIAEDSLFAPAWTGLARAMLGAPVDETSTGARAAAQRAIEIDDGEAEAHVLLASLLYQRDWDWDGAEYEFRRALQLAPGRADLHHAYALFLAATQRKDAAMTEISRAMRLDPVSTLVIGDAAFIHYLARDYDGAVSHALRVLDIDPENIWSHTLLVHAYTAMGRDDEAVRYAGDLGRIVQPVSGTRTGPSTAVPASDMSRFWEEWILWWRTNASGPPVAYHVAIGFARLGQPDSAIASLASGVGLRAGGLTTIAAEPAFDGLHADRRFQAVLGSIGLPHSGPADPSH